MVASTMHIAEASSVFSMPAKIRRPMVEFRSVGMTEKLTANPAGASRKSNPSVTPSVRRFAIMFWMTNQKPRQRIAMTTICQKMPAFSLVAPPRNG